MSEFTTLVAATGQMYREALRDGSASLTRHFWIAGLVPAYTIVLGLSAALTMRLGMIGGLLQYLAMAACLSSFLAVIGEAVAHQRVRFDGMAQTFGRYFNSIISVFFIFWIVDLILSMVAQSTPNILWFVIFVKTAIFVVFNPVPELIYQGHRSGMGLLEDSIQFVKANTIEWLLPVLMMMAPFFAINIRTGFLAMARVSPTNALAFVIDAIGQFLPLTGAPASIVATLLASIGITWIMLCRGFLFRSLARGGRRQRIFAARMRS
ncbi:MAG: hypothetical protein ABGY42_01945 [bacterium]